MLLFATRLLILRIKGHKWQNAWHILLVRNMNTACMYSIRCMEQFRVKPNSRYLTVEATKSLVCAFVNSRSQTILILFYLAGHVTFSADHKFRFLLCSETRFQSTQMLSCATSSSSSSLVTSTSQNRLYYRLPTIGLSNLSSSSPACPSDLAVCTFSVSLFCRHLPC